jgi:hypothetical protein
LPEDVTLAGLVVVFAGIFDMVDRRWRAEHGA